jgi:hypothetical protein
MSRDKVLQRTTELAREEKQKEDKQCTDKVRVLCSSRAEDITKMLVELLRKLCKAASLSL